MTRSRRRARPRSMLAYGTLAALATLAVTVALTAALTVAVTVVSTPSVLHAQAAPLGLVEQTFNVPADGTVSLTVRLPKGVTLPVEGFSVKVTALRPVDTREQVATAIAGDLPPEIDTVELLPLAIPRPKPDLLRLAIPVEVTTTTDEALQLSRPAVYPVHVSVLKGDLLLAELITFVHRVPSEAEGLEDAMPVAMAITTEQQVVLDDEARLIIDDATRAELTALADLLEASAIPLAVRIPPSVLTTLADGDATDAELALRLSDAMADDDLISSPILPLDVSLAAAADQAALYTQWLRDGEDSLAAVIDAPAQRTNVLVDEPLSKDGGQLLRNLGARLLVMPTALYDSLPGTLGGFTDSTQLVQIEVAPDITLDAAVVDRTIAPALARATSTPELTAIFQVADLLAARQQVRDSGGDPRRHGLLLGTPDLGLPSPTGFGAFTTLLADTPGLRPTTVDDLGVRTDQLLGAEGPVVVQLPDTVDGDLTPRIDLQTSLGLDAASTASMLPTGDQRTGDWSRLIDVLPTGALTDDQVGGITADLRAEFQALRDSIEVPVGFSFNLTGRTGTVPVTLRNNADIPLTVRVRMSSSKLIFPDGDQTVVLPPQAFHEVRINIEARTNGSSGVTLEVFTPLGDVRLAPPVPLTAKINALSGVGNLLTGAALLVLLTWWVRHFRRNRRARRAAETAQRHPCTRPDGDIDESADDAVGEADSGDIGIAVAVVDDAVELSPDAATSTLPPS